MKAFVPKGFGTDFKTGQPFEYGGYEVELHDCSVCGGVYADAEQHGGTAGHKRMVSTPMP